MKKIITIKKLLMAMVFSIAILGGYQVYENVSLTNAEALLLENAEALTQSEGDPTACPNGCLTDLGCCWCYEEYDLEEKVWSPDRPLS